MKKTTNPWLTNWKWEFYFRSSLSTDSPPFWICSGVIPSKDGSTTLTAPRGTDPECWRSKGVLECLLLEDRVGFDDFLEDEWDRWELIERFIGVNAGDQDVVVPIEELRFSVSELSIPRIDSGVGSIASGEGVTISKTLNLFPGVTCSGSTGSTHCLSNDCCLGWVPIVPIEGLVGVGPTLRGLTPTPELVSSHPPVEGQVGVGPTLRGPTPTPEEVSIHPLAVGASVGFPSRLGSGGNFDF